MSLPRRRESIFLDSRLRGNDKGKSLFPLCPLWPNLEFVCH